MAQPNTLPIFHKEKLIRSIINKEIINPDNIQSVEFSKSSAECIYLGKSYGWEYKQWEILAVHGEVSYTHSSGYGRHERHELEFCNPEWDDVNIEDIKQFMIENWDRKVEVVE